MKVLIVGGGIAGPALAAFLKQKGISSEIVEKASNWDHLGYSIGLWDNGRKMLEKLGLGTWFKETGTISDSFYIANGKGKIMRLYSFDEFRKKYGMGRVQVHRKDLHEQLMHAASGTKIRLGTTVESITETEDKIKVQFSDKTEGEYDLVIGADGVKSRVRDLVFGSGFVHFADWRAFFFWTSQRPEIPQGVFEMIEHGAFCGIFAEMGNQSLVVLAIPAEHATFDNPEDRLLRLQQYFKDFSWQLPEIMKPLKAEDLLPTDIAFVIMDQWVKGRVALIGDAAHAMEPFAGMGSSMALEDAYVLADELSKTDSANIPQALLRYQERMRKRIEIARRQTRSIWWWTKIQSRIICTLRNLLMPYFPIKHFTKGYDYLLNRDV